MNRGAFLFQLSMPCRSIWHFFSVYNTFSSNLFSVTFFSSDFQTVFFFCFVGQKILFVLWIRFFFCLISFEFGFYYFSYSFSLTFVCLHLHFLKFLLFFWIFFMVCLKLSWFFFLLSPNTHFLWDFGLNFSELIISIKFIYSKKAKYIDR